MVNSKNKSLVIKCRSTQPLRLVESADSTDKLKKYVFEGVFTACSDDTHTIVNRNGRIYRKEEMLRHLGYLREQIKENKFILGELDHPDSRFDVRLKEASHAITDLYFDPSDCTVKGKLFVLDTPNGMILRSLIDNGFPVFVSSRAAGEVDPKTKEVHIEQIFTYDCVYQPGFEEAKLNRVMEGLNTKQKQYLNESVSAPEANETSTKKYGVITEGVSVSESSRPAPIDKKAMKMKEQPIDMKDLCTPIRQKLNEDDESSFQMPQMSLDPKSTDVKEGDGDADGDEKKNSEKTLTDDEKKARRDEIIGIEAVEKGDEETDSDKQKKRDEIIDVEGEEKKDGEDGSDESGDENKNEDKDDSGEKKNGETKSEDECDKAGSTDECGDGEECDGGLPNDIKTKEKEANAKDVEKKALNDKKSAEDVKSRTKKDMDKIKELLKKAEKQKDVKEGIVKLYPFSISLSDKNFAQFAALPPKGKNMVQKFILEHDVTNVADINQLWKTPLITERRDLKNWLRLASDEDKKLFADAPMDVQDAIEESAKYVTINTKEDAERFWSRTGLRQRHNSRILRESLNESYGVKPKESVSKEDDATNERASELGYQANYFKMLEDMY